LILKWKQEALICGICQVFSNQGKINQGICLAIIRTETTPGRITVRATAEGLKEASLTIKAK
jgi:hypothetical protein